MKIESWLDDDEKKEVASSRTVSLSPPSLSLKFLRERVDRSTILLLFCENFKTTLRTLKRVQSRTESWDGFLLRLCVRGEKE